MFSVPIELPAASVPPASTVTPLVVPLPPSVPPFFTVTPLDDAIELFTDNVPPVMVTGPVKPEESPVRLVAPAIWLIAPLPLMPAAN